MKICVTGGAGYVGTLLTRHLLNENHEVTVLDTFWYGDFLHKHPRLKKIKGDIRSVSDVRRAFTGQEAVIHLACVSNDPSFDMNPDLGKEINYGCFKDMLKIVNEESVARFIYASSSSVYGLSDRPDVTEDAPKNPLTDYSKYKLACETWLKSYGTGGSWTILRPATVCGYSPRMRLDLVVNILTSHAVYNKKITLYGKQQMRPNINIQDMVRAYDWVLNKPHKYVDHKTFNVGFENMSLFRIANIVKETLVDASIKIVEQPTNDPRSYHVNSDKIKDLGFEPKHDVKDAIRSLVNAFNKDLLGQDPINNPIYHNIKRMRELGL